MPKRKTVKEKRNLRFTAVLIVILVSALFAYLASNAKAENSINIDIEREYDGQLAVIENGQQILKIRVSAYLAISYAGVISSSSINGKLQVFFDNNWKQEIAFSDPQISLSGQKYALTSLNLTNTQIQSWAMQFGSHTLKFLVPSGTTLSVTFTDGKQETKTYSAASVTLTLSVQSDSGIIIANISVESGSELPSSTILFADDFGRHNFHAWTGFDTSDAGASITISSTKAYDGAYSAKSTRDGNVANQWARLRRNYGSLHKEISLEARVLISNLPSSEGQVCLLTLNHDNVEFCSELVFARFGESVSCYLSYYKNGDMNYIWDIPAPTPNVWTHYKLHFKSDTDGRIELYVGDVLAANDSGFDSSGVGGANQIILNRFGVGTFAMDTYFDAVVVTVPEDIEPLSNENLAEIPDDWGLTYGNGQQIIFLDYSVVRTFGKPSIRLEPHTSNDVNTARECDGIWYSINPGDRIVAKCWMKTDSSTPQENADIYHGARIGLDFYAHTSQGYGILEGPGHPQNGQEHIDGMVMWNTPEWTLKTWDFIVPTTYYTQVWTGAGGVVTCGPVQVEDVVLWMQAMQVNDGTAIGRAWFADAELYINP